jgi:hypothetical protein
MASDYRYSDSRKGTYVNQEASPGNVSLVNNPNGNEYLDESHRDMSDENFRPEFSNLENTYMFSANGHNARNRFWGKEYAKDFSYRNSNADIDDPIFTGFTLSIDRLNSPLFYTIGEYDGSADGRKRNSGGAFRRNIADQIENCLRNNYSSLIRASVNSYDISAILTKEKYPNSDEKIGYGMQNNIYVDGLPYGATEYIYMVDKQVKDRNSSQDVGGHYSLGDGSKTVAAKDVVDKDDLLQNKSMLSEKIKEHKDKLKGHESKHAENERKRDEVRGKLDNNRKERDKLNNEIKALENTLSKSGNVTFETAVREKLKDNLTRIDNAVINLKPTGNRSTHTLEQYQTICNTISSLDTKLQSEIAKYDNNPDNVQKLVPSVKKEDVEVLTCTIRPDTPTNMDEYGALPIEGKKETFDGRVYYVMGAKYRNLTITVSVARNNKADADAVTAKIKDLKKKMESLDKEEMNLNKELKEKTLVCETDAYSHVQHDLERAEDDMRGVQQSIDDVKNDSEIEINGSQTVSQDAELHTGDVSQGVEDDATFQNSNKETLPDAPQTVYDMLGFIRGMKRLTSEYPYLMQTINGLDEAYKNNYGVKDSFRGSGDNKITISIYESLDLKVSGMFNKYFNAVYDAQYRRERVPVNLRRFNCSVFVHDIRNFYRMATAMGGVIRKSGGANIPKIVEVALNTMSAVEFKFFGCEIVPEETGSIFDNVSNAERGDMRMTNFTFTYSDCVINYLPFEDMKHNLLKNVGNGPHRPHVSVNGGVKRPADELKFGSGGKVYNMTSQKFDSMKPTLVGMSNVNDDGTTVVGGESNSTAPQHHTGDVPETLAEKMGYRLNSPLGNTNPDTPVKYGRVSDVGKADVSSPERPKVREMDNVYSKTSGPYDSGSPGYDVVRHGYFDRTPLGNVNNDDYDEYRNLRAGRDAGAVVMERRSENMAELGALGSVNENRTQYMEDFERIFDHLATSVAASVGMPRENVYDTYLDEIRHIVFPSYNTQTTGKINYTSSADNTNTTVVPNVPQLGGIISSKKNGVVSDIGNVNANDSMEPTPKPNGNVVNVGGLSTRLGSGNIISGLGDVLPDDPRKPAVGNIGDVLPDDPHKPAVTGLGDVLPDDPNVPSVDNLGNVYPPEGSTRKVKVLGDILPDDPNVPSVDKIGNVYPNMTNPDTTSVIGDVLPDDPNVPAVGKIGNVYPDTGVSGVVEYVGDVLPDDPKMPPVGDIGNIYPHPSEPDDVRHIGDVLPDTQDGKVVDEMGNVYGDGDGYVENVDDLGNVYRKTVSDILKKLDIISKKPVVKVLGKVDGQETGGSGNTHK